MQVTASAPGKAILFGEHAVVYGKPSIAVAVDRKVHLTVRERSDGEIHVNVKNPNLSGYIDLGSDSIKLADRSGKKGILHYVLNSLKKVHQKGGLEIELVLEMPVGAGLGSSAAVAVATIAAVSKLNKINLSRNEIAAYSHQVELEVQGAASPIDTTLSTYGGVIYLSKDAQKIIPLPLNWDMPLVIGYTSRRGNTGKLIESVKLKRKAHPQIVDNILYSMEQVTENARQALLDRNERDIGDLMNINQGLLDALGVNTRELSGMIYAARSAGAIGSKITGAGGGGSIIAYCPGRLKEVLFALQKLENAFRIRICTEGVAVKVAV